MAHATLEYIRGLRRSLAAKKAEIVGQDPDTIPGAEHNKPVPESAKQPDPETRDGTMVPNSGLTTAGAGDDSPITHTNDLKADEPALVPKKEPMITDEADAKTAEALAAEILTSIDDWEKKQAQSLPDGATSEELVTDKGGAEPKQTDDSIPPKKEPAVSADAMVEPGSSAQGETACASKEAAECNGKKCDGKPAECNGKKCDGKPAECKAECKGKPAECKAECKGKKDDAKTAGAFDLELTSDVLAKIAAVMLATDEGTKFAEKALSKVAGAVAAERTLSFLRKQSAYAEQAVKRAEDTAASAESGAPAEIQQVADAIDSLVESGEITEDEADQLVQEIAQTANAQTAVPDAGVQEEVKQVADAIDTLVESGEITEDEADQLVQDIAQAANAQVPDGTEKEAESIFTAGQRDAVLKIAQALDVDPSALAAAADEAQSGQPPVMPVDPYAQAAEATINDQVAVPPEQFDPASVPQGDVGEITVDDVADAIDTLVESGEITEDEADQLVQEIAGETATAGSAGTGDPQVSPEEVADALQSAVASGDLKPEDVQAVLGELESVPAPESAAQPAAAASTAPAEEAAPVAPADDAKTAAANLIAAIRAARRPAK